MMQQPRQGELRDRSAVDFGCSVQFAARVGEFTCGYREPWDKRNFMFRAVFDHVFVAAVADVVLVLHADDLDYLTGLIDLVRFHLAETDVANLSLLLNLLIAPSDSSTGTLGSMRCNCHKSMRSFLETAGSFLPAG